MCTTCGCGLPEKQPHSHSHEHGHEHNHSHDHDAPPASDAGNEAERRRVSVEQALFAKNDRLAAGNRGHLARHGAVAFNLVSSPGAGKTSLLVRTLTDLQGQVSMAVIEGDQATDLDARRIEETGTPAVQINTGPGCHLDAEMVADALDRLEPHPFGVLFVENVGNLVCPAAFDLGETAKVVVVSVTEGDDKPLKYPDMFAAASLMIATKTDLLAYVPADLDRLVENAGRVNPAIETLAVSVQDGTGLDDWYRWIESRRRQAFPNVAVEHAVHA